MRNNTKTSRRIQSVVAALLMFFCVNAYADNKIYIEDFSIKPGETKTVAVNLDNSDLIAALEMLIQLPEGLDYVEGSLKRNEERLDRDIFSVNMVEQYNMPKLYKLAILPQSWDNIPGNSGALVYFDVTATASFTATSHINVYDIFGSSTEEDENGHQKLYKIPGFNVSVSPMVGKIYFSSDAVSIKTDGTEKKLSVILDNDIDVRGIQAEIELPAELTFVTKANGKPKFDYGDRLQPNSAISSNFIGGKLRIIISDATTTDVIKGNTGEVFSFYVKANDELALKSEIKLSGVHVSDNSNITVDYTIEDIKNIEVTNYDLACLAPANTVIEALRTALSDAVKKIETDYANVKDNEALTTAQADITKMINDLQAAVNDAYSKETLDSEYETVVTAPAAAVTAAIEKLLADAEALSKQAINDNAYTRLTGEIAELQKTFDEAKEKVATDCKDVADQFAEAEEAIQASIDALTADVNTKHENGELTEESKIETADITAAIEKYIADAVEAQTKFTDNKDAYTRLTGEIAELQKTFDEAKEKVATDCKDVADQFAEAEEAIQASIDALTADVNTKHENGELTEESKIETADITAAIEKYIADAVEAQTKFTDNKDAYTRLTGEIAELQKTFDEAKEKVATDCKDVADQFAEAEEAIQASIDALTADVNTKHENGELTEESKIETADITAAIEKYIADAVEAQTKFTDNKDAYTRLTGEIAELQKTFDEAKEKVATDCKDVADQFAEAEEAIQASIDALTADVNTKHENGELTEESKIETADITAAIEKYIADAVEAQNQFTGIYTITGANGAEIESIHTASGNRVQTPVRGKINIVKYTDGTVKKYYVK